MELTQCPCSPGQAAGGAGSPSQLWDCLALPLAGLLSIACSFAKLKLLELKFSMSYVCLQLISFSLNVQIKRFGSLKKIRWEGSKLVWSSYKHLQVI